MRQLLLSVALVFPLMFAPNITLAQSAVEKVMDHTGDGVGNVLRSPDEIAAGRDGTLYIVSRRTDRVFKIELDPDGNREAPEVIWDGSADGDETTCPDRDDPGLSFDPNNPCIKDRPLALAVDKNNGNLYIGLDAWTPYLNAESPPVNFNRVIMLEPDADEPCTLMDQNWDLKQITDLAVDPTNGEVFVTARGGGHLFRIPAPVCDTSSPRVRTSPSPYSVTQGIPDPSGLAVHPNHIHVFVATGADGAYATGKLWKMSIYGGSKTLWIDGSVIDPATGYPRLRSARQVELSPDGSYVYVTGHESDNVLATLANTTGDVDTLIQNLDGACGLAVGPEGTVYATGKLPGVDKYGRHVMLDAVMARRTDGSLLQLMGQQGDGLPLPDNDEDLPPPYRTELIDALSVTVDGILNVYASGTTSHSVLHVNDDRMIDSFLMYKATHARVATGRAPRFTKVPAIETWSDHPSYGLNWEQNIDAKKTYYIGAPADVSGTGIIDPNNYLLGFKASRNRYDEVTELTRGIHVVNQLDHTGIELVTSKVRIFLVPANITGGRLPLQDPNRVPEDGHQLDHYKCYRAKSRYMRESTYHEVTDALQSRLYEVNGPQYLCVPADSDLNHTGLPRLRRNKDYLLLCYRARRAMHEPRHVRADELKSVSEFARPNQQLNIRTRTEFLLCSPSFLVGGELPAN